MGITNAIRGGHVIIPIVLALFAKCFWIFVVDSPRIIYNCPLDAVERWDDNCVWSKSYEEARGLFVALGNRLKESAHPDLINAQSIMFDVERGTSSHQSTITAGSNTIDALLLTMKVGGDNQANVVNVIHSAGTHGVEGFAGSAIQLNLLREMILQSTEEQSSTEKPYVRKILLIHAVNPFGMRHHRRFNENNVDLNRNVLSREQWEEVRSRDPNVFGYVTLDRVLNPFHADGFSWVEAVGDGFAGDLAVLQDDKAYKASEQAQITTWFGDLKDIAYTFVNCLTTIAVTGYRQAKKTMVSSQYHKQQGIFYGGGAHNDNEWEPSITFVQHAIQDFGGLDFNSDQAIWIDIHTGLGAFGEFSLLTKGPGDAASPLRYQSLIAAGSGDFQVSVGYEETKGFVNDNILCPQSNCFGLTQEFGTRPGLAVAIALVLENKAFHIGGNFNYLTSWAFYPQRLSWRRRVIDGGMELFRATLSL